ncbi:hypothetical protein [Polynucleobacter sp. HIN5]|uniref:hypothetical protein n=1 Tax=Polynucleobacter sp. HIN5 TaxID=3047864 RepID=UPI0025739DBC|nr:hypothetical protein [Polynucleobacter sp. HIN5]BEI33213.1 hypothetical protein PHIN5_05810 [Polynucleobacter sp. HIN5]
MKTKKSELQVAIDLELKEFRKLLLKEIEPARKAYEKEKKRYELVMKNLITKKISNQKNFKKDFDSAFQELREIYRNERPSDFVNDFRTLEYMIESHESFLENFDDFQEV